MFSGKKKKIQVKSVEEYLKGSDVADLTPSDQIPPFDLGVKPKKPLKTAPNMKAFIIQAAVVIVILALLMTALSQISAVKTEVAELQHKEGDSQALKNQITDLSAKLDKSNKKVENLNDRIADLEKDLEAQKSQRIAAAEAAKKSAAANVKKKPAKPAKPAR